MTNQYLRRKADPHRYCQKACAERTRCGPVIVPEKHLQVSSAAQCFLIFEIFLFMVINEKVTIGSCA